MYKNHYRHGKQTAAFTAALRTSNAVTTLTAHAFAAPVGIRSQTEWGYWEPLPMPCTPKPATVLMLAAWSVTSEKPAIVAAAERLQPRAAKVNYWGLPDQRIANVTREAIKAMHAERQAMGL